MTTKTIELKFERTIPAPPDEVFGAWLDPKVPGNPWNTADKLLLTPQVDGFFYWSVKGTSHYGRFTEVERPGRLQHLASICITKSKEAAIRSFLSLLPSALPGCFHFLR
jgi:hypothetical protein